ncbi:hypothetical protein Celaphus_00012560 [Cervus elaphus hippelaphus]|uniref:Chordin n=1 Tax=Cervus elaphus hippelaphus TaxID=46360 RepID=A0A212CIW1_CEREH|nr:hypothetical protein Celaphus_00012560 [Cervus elaphus hippelaphus]
MICWVWKQADELSLLYILAVTWREEPSTPPPTPALSCSSHSGKATLFLTKGCPGTWGPARSTRGGHTAGAGQRPPAKPVPAGCSFGGKVYALDETWHPDLGEPFGVMRCVLCACEAVFRLLCEQPQWGRRARGAGRVSCKNIKPECPTLACGQPRQLPGHCCQTCPQEHSSPEKQPTGLAFEYPRDPEHRSYSDRGEPGAEDRGRGDGHTDFVALLTGPRSQAVARARVSLQRSSLRFSISYRRAEQLYVALVTPAHPSGEVWGPLIRHRALAAGFAEVLPNLTAQEMDWLVLGELQMALERASGPGLRISGHIAARQSCDGNGSLIYQVRVRGGAGAVWEVQVVGTGSEVVAMTLETKPQRRNQHTVLCHMVGLQPGGHRAVGICPGLGARGAHMLLQNELFLNVGTKDFPDGELRGHVAALPYSGHSARHDTLPVPLAGALVLPPVQSQAAGHAWLSLDTHCHLHYEVLLAGLGGSEQGTITAHLLGPPGMPGPRRLLKGFYGPEGSASLLITTKGSPQGELRGQVHIANQCEVGGLRLAAAGDKEMQAPGALEAVAAMVAPLPAVPGPDTPAPAKPGGPGRLRDPNTCFFEGQQRPHGARWAPNYDPLCSLCTCQRRTVICDPVVCPPPSCPSPVQAPDQCCPVCPEKQDVKDLPGLPRNRDPGEGCYFDGDRSWRAAGTRWHPVVPPFGLIKCAVCTCKGDTGEVHCEKVQCPRLACAQPVRANPTDCCKQCPGQWFPESQSWHPSVPPFGEMSCITCRCGQAGVPHCERDDCSPPLSCGPGKESRCCSHCTPRRRSAPETRTVPELGKEDEGS